jgi:hypothetical protein
MGGLSTRFGPCFSCLETRQVHLTDKYCGCGFVATDDELIQILDWARNFFIFPFYNFTKIYSPHNFYLQH